MTLITRIFSLFGQSSDNDLYEEIKFKERFVGVVNFLVLVLSLVLGLYSMLDEDSILATLNLAFAFFFMGFFVLTIMSRKEFSLLVVVDRIMIFLFFIDLHATCGYHGVVGLATYLYPLIAMVTLGRHKGVIMSIAMSGGIALYYIFSVHFFEIGSHHSYTLLETITIICVHFVSMFIYYTVFRWVDELIYIKDAELLRISNEQTNKRKLVERLIAGVDKPLSEIYEASQVLSNERLNALQTELVSLIRASSETAKNNMDSIIKADSNDIPVLLREEVVFNLNVELTNVLKLYKSKHKEKRHRHSTEGVPDIIIGNKTLTKQILYNILDALENKAELSVHALELTVSRNNMLERELVLNYNIFVDYDLKLGEQDRSNTSDNIIDYLGCDVTKRIIESEGERLVATSDKTGVKLEFSLHYKDAMNTLGLTPEELAQGKLEFQQNLTLKDCTILVMTEDEMLWSQLNYTLSGYVHELRRSHTTQETLDIFTNNRIDAIITEMQSDGGSATKLVKLIRDAESGVAKKIPMISFVDPDNHAEYINSNIAGFDMTLNLPYDEDSVRAMVSSFFM